MKRKNVLLYVDNALFGGFYHVTALLFFSD